jgi:CRP-like cAMP-binding protein
MKDRFITYFSRFAPLTEVEAQTILDGMVVRTFPKGTVLLEAGQVSREIYFILQGCVRQYYMVDGEEKTSNFFVEDQWVMSMQSYTLQTPATHFFGCVEDCTLVIGDDAGAAPLYQQFPRFEEISRQVLERGLGEQQEMAASYVVDSPEQRYLRLLQTRPDLLQRVPQYQLASYIGVKPESLSRIRRRIQSRK